MRVIVVGLGVQGHKRRRFAGDPTLSRPSIRAQSRGRLSRCARGSARRIRRGAALHPRRSRRSNCSAICIEHGKHVLVEKPLVAEDEAALARLQQDARAKGVVLLHRLQSPLRAALRAHARSGRVRRARPHLSLPHVLRQRHGAAGAQFRLARSGRRRARPISARICSIRRGSGSATSATRSRSYRPTASRTAPRPRRVRGPRRAPAARIRDDAADLAQSFHLRRVRRERQRAHQLAVQVGTVRVHPPHAHAAERPSARADR